MSIFKSWKFWVAPCGCAALVAHALVCSATITSCRCFFRITLFAALGLAWNLVGGYAGQLSLGHVAFFGVGAYGLALLRAAWYSRLDLHHSSRPLWQRSLPLIIGMIAFRLRGPYFTLATIAFGEVLRLDRHQSERDRRRHRSYHARALHRQNVLALVLSRRRRSGGARVSYEPLDLALALWLLPHGHP